MKWIGNLSASDKYCACFLTFEILVICPYPNNRNRVFFMPTNDEKWTSSDWKSSALSPILNFVSLKMLISRITMSNRMEDNGNIQNVNNTTLEWKRTKQSSLPLRFDVSYSSYRTATKHSRIRFAPFLFCCYRFAGVLPVMVSFFILPFDVQWNFRSMNTNHLH